MKRTAVLTGTFDPVTKGELCAAKRIFHTQGVDEVVLKVNEEEGILSRSEREYLLSLAVKPWRHIHTSFSGTADATMTIDITVSEEERMVREGKFSLAADGTRKKLVEEGYYFETVMDFMCKPSRAAHSRSVAQVCRELACIHGLDEKKAWQAGILHDVTKKWNDDDAEKIVELYYPEMLGMSPNVWHSYTAPVFLKQALGIQDKELLHAIECHTIGNGTSALDHILYIADKCEPLRGYDSSFALALSRKDLAAGAAYVKEESRKYILETEGIDVGTS